MLSGIQFDAVRLISVRKANERESSRYEKAKKDKGAM